jgi:hypothetical protein
VAGEWTARAQIFSGRPNPQWRLEAREAESLVEKWRSLPPFKGDLPKPPILGYQGCSLQDVPGNREWYAFGGVVSQETMQGVDRRLDDRGLFERRLLASAPEGLLPDSLRNSLRF